MHVDVEIKLYRHVDMEKTCRPQHYYATLLIIAVGYFKNKIYIS